MSGPWEDYAAADDGPWSDYAKPKRQPNVVKDVAKSGASGGLKGTAALTDLISMAGGTGFLRNTLAGVNALGDLALNGRVRTDIAGTPTALSKRANALAHKPETRAGRYAEAVGEQIPNAIAPGGVLRKAASVVFPGVMGEGVREGASAVGFGAKGQAVAKLAGNILGGIGASAQRNPILRQGDDAARHIPRQDPAALRQRAQEYRDAGIDPTFIDVADDSGRGAVRAAASRMTPARQRATDFQDARQLDLPSRIGGQARRLMSQDPRTPDQIREAMAAQRSANAEQAFGTVRGDTVQLAPEGVQALRTDYGRRAIAEAARRERDPTVRAALNRLANDALDAPSTPITVGMADRVSRVLLGQAQEAGRRGDNDLAATLSGLGRSVREPTRQASQGYGQALEGFAADSRLQEAAGVGESLMTRNTDEFVQQAGRLNDEERNLALAAGRRAIERRAGEGVGAAPGVARQLANAPEQQARNAALMGPERAGQLQNAMRLEERAVRNANDIAPRMGSQTQNKAQDAANMAAAGVRVGSQIARHDYIGIGVDWLRSRGMNDAQAEALVNMALDPARTDEAIQIITQRFGPQAARQAIEWRNAALIGATGGAIAASGSQ
jgi:hypothetical protein